jgi:hypothetical protein
MMLIPKVKANLKRFRSRKNPPILLPFPVSPTLRLAQLSPGPKFANVRPFILKRWSNLQIFAPNVVVGSLSEVQTLADHAALGSFDASSVDHALVILTRYRSKPLNDMARVALWQSFGVPIFELYLGLDHSLLAAECEAHEGWHLASGVGFLTLETGELILDGAGNSGLRTGLRASLDREPCPCGRTSARILDIEQMGRLDPCYLAASA